MKIPIDQVRKIANLARLDFEEQELKQFAREFSEIIDFVDSLSQVETGNEAPLFHGLDPAIEPTLWREDLTRPSLPVTDIFESAPASDDGQFQVPRVID